MGAAIGAAFAGREIIQAAQRQEDAINSLNNSLRAAGTFSEGASKGIQDFATAIQATTTLGDEAVLEQVALARNFTRTNEEATKLTEAAIELSAATGISLDSAVKNLGKTFGGLTGELGESVPALRNLTKEQLQAGEAIDFVLDRFGGSAQAQVKTFSGAVTQLENVFGDLLEELGFLITRNPIVVKTIEFVSKEIQNLTKGVNSLSEDSEGFLKPIILSGIDVVNFFVNTLGPAVDVITTLFNRLGKTLGGLAASAVQLFSGEFAQAAETAQTTLSEAFDLSLDSNVTERTTELLNRYRDSIIGVSEAQRILASEIENTNNEISEQGNELAINIAEPINKVTVSAFSALGASLNEGSAAFGNFAKQSGVILGDFFIKLGSTIISTALAIDALKTSILSFGTGVAVAAGAGLIIAGSALKSFAGGPVNQGASLQAAGTVADGADTVTASLEDLDQIQETGPSVQLNVQGNILDRRETGLELAEVIREAFDGNAVVFNS